MHDEKMIHTSRTRLIEGTLSLTGKHGRGRGVGIGLGPLCDCLLFCLQTLGLNASLIVMLGLCVWIGLELLWAGSSSQ